MEVSFPNDIAELLGSTFASPGWFLLVALAAAAVVFVRIRSGKAPRLWPLRLIVVALISAALADPVVKNTRSVREIFALFDVSKSVSPDAATALLQMLTPFVGTTDKQSQKQAVHVLLFAADAASDSFSLRSLSDLKSLATSLGSMSSKLDGGATDIGAALEAARKHDAPVLLLSDGFETAGSSRGPAATLAAAGLKIFPLVPSEDAFLSAALSLSAFQAPLVANSGDLVEVFTTIRNSGDEEMSGVLDIFAEDTKLYSRVVSVPAHQERLVSVKAPPGEHGLKRLRAVLTPEEPSSKPSELVRWVSVRAKAKLLLVSGSENDKRVLEQLLSLKGYSLESVVAGENKTENEAALRELGNYSAVILNNAPANALPSGFLDQLRSFVAKGGGAILIGGDRSFGLGRYIGTPLEEISPVRFVPPQTTKRKLNSAVVLLVDKSRSMSSDGKIDAARRAALVSIQALKDEDYASVIGFDTSPFVILPIALVSEIKDMAERRLFNLTAAGKTELLPGLAVARQQLAKVDAGRKHIIILTDGKVPEQGNLYEQTVSQMRAEGITVTTVGVGADADVPFLQSLSQVGKGAFYHTLDPSRLPEIFLHDIQVTTGEKTLKESGDTFVRLGPDGLVSTSGRDFPQLRGFVQTLPKRDARVELVIADDEGFHPLLASWNYDKGVVVAYTSDANGRWSLPWLSWNWFPRFWSGLIEAVEHEPESETAKLDFDLRTSVSRRALLLDLALFDSRLGSEAAPPVFAEIRGPGGLSQRVTFSASAKGRFSASLDNARPGDYRVGILYGSTKLPEIGLTLGGELFGEAPGRGLDHQNLAELASMTGGVINPDISQVTAREIEQQSRKHLAPPFVLAAFLLYFAEIFWRELRWSGIRSLLGFIPARLNLPGRLRQNRAS